MPVKVFVPVDVPLRAMIGVGAVGWLLTVTVDVGSSMTVPTTSEPS